MNRRTKLVLLLLCFNLFGCNTFKETYILQIRSGVQSGDIPANMGMDILCFLGRPVVIPKDPLNQDLNSRETIEKSYGPFLGKAPNEKEPCCDK